MYGFYNRGLRINLSTGRHDVFDIDDALLACTLGGKGLATHFLLEEGCVGRDPLAPDNLIIFATGPVTGSSVWGSSRYGVFTKSPQTGFYSESYSGGHAPEFMDAAATTSLSSRARPKRLSGSRSVTETFAATPQMIFGAWIPTPPKTRSGRKSWPPAEKNAGQWSSGRRRRTSSDSP